MSTVRRKTNKQTQNMVK